MAIVSRVGDPLWINRAMSTRDARVATAGLLSTVWGDSLSARPGVLPETGLQALKVIPTSPASMSVLVNQGHVVVVQPEQGPWIVPVETVVTLDVPPPDATNPRIDLVVVRVYDLDQGETPPVEPDAGGRGVATIEIVPGTASGTPAPPPVPPRSFVLGQIQTTPTTTTIGPAQLTDTRTWTVARGGVRPLLGVTTDLLPGFTGEMVSLVDGTVAVGVNDPTNPYRGVQAGRLRATQDIREGTFTTTEWVATVNLPDPGFPYQIHAEASLSITVGPHTRIDVWARLDTPQGPFVCVPSVGEIVYTSQQDRSLWTARFLGANLGRVYTGAHNVCLVIGKIYGSSGTGYSIEAQNSAFAARVVPYIGP